MHEIIKALRTLRVGKTVDEYKLQDQIAEALSAAGVAFQKEYYLGIGNRVDFLADWGSCTGVAIEVKKGKPNRERLIRQIERYADFDVVGGIIIVVETSLKYPPMHAINGKPCEILGLQKLWGIAL